MALLRYFLKQDYYVLKNSKWLYFLFNRVAEKNFMHLSETENFVFIKHKKEMLIVLIFFEI